MALNSSFREKIPPETSLSPAPGDILDFFVYNSRSGEEKHIYSRFSRKSYTFLPGDYVEYDVNLLEKIAGAGGIEIFTSHGSTFRNENEWVDQNNVSGNPAADLSDYAYRKWYHRVLPVPASMLGKSAAQWALAGENDEDAQNYEVQYANLVVTNGKGDVKEVIFRAAKDFQWDALGVIDYTHPVSASLSAVAQNGGSSGNPRVITPLYPSEDIIVASFIATEAPYRADPAGIRDATAAIQQALTECYNSGGGVVWLPVGKYRITGSIHIPAHVTLRGDWRDPEKGSGGYGTVIVADVPSGSENDPGLFRIWGSAGVKGLTVYYPNQSMPDPTAYPYTFEILGRFLGEDGYMSGSVQNVTLLNSYRGISAGKDAIHELHAIRNVKGTVLALGIYLQDTADVGKVERITLNNSYWANLDPSLSQTHPGRAQINAWTQQNGTGLVMGGVEWDQLTQLSLSDYALGIGFVQGRRIESTLMMFDIKVENCQVAMRVSNLDSRIGLVVSSGIFHASPGRDAVAIQITDDNGASVIFDNTVIGGGAGTAVRLSGNTTATFLSCSFDEWAGSHAIVATSGTLAIEGSRFLQNFSAQKKGILLEPGVHSAVLLGNIYPAGGSDYLLENNSSADVKRQDQGYSVEKHGVASYPWLPGMPHPISSNFYNVRLFPYGAQADGQADDTAAVQDALNDAGRAGGGTVFLPAGIYRILGHLVVPAGVELRGSDDIPHRAMRMGRSTGTILFASEGRGTQDPDGASPFILLDGAGAGVRGISIHYPEQAAGAAENIAAYPWTIRGNGDAVYACDVALSNAWRAIDFATHPTNHHYINQVVGLALKEGIRVGNSTEGRVEDCLFNINAWPRAQGLPGLMDEAKEMFAVVGKYTHANLRAFVVTAGAQNEHLLSNFVYGAHEGHTFESYARAVAINIAADGSVDTLTLNVEGTGQTVVKVINAEGCGCALGGVGLHVNNGTARIWNFITMEPYAQAIKVTGGDVLLEGAAFHHSLALIEGGNTTLNGVLFRDAGDHVTIRGGKVNLWGNMGGESSFRITGSPASQGNNIGR